MSTSMFPGQHEDEEVLLVFRQHPLVMRKALIFGLFAILLAVIPFDFEQIYTYSWIIGVLSKLIIAVIAVVVIIWFLSWVGWYYSVYIVTDQRIVEIRQRGLFNRRVSEWRLDMVQNVNYHVNGFQGVLFGFGDITAQTFSGDLVMAKIHKPVHIHAQLIKIVHDAGGGSTPARVSGNIS